MGEKINIGITIPLSADHINQDKVVKLATTFADCCDEIDANLQEVGAVISILQDHYWETFGAIPVSQDIIAAIREADDVYVAKEE